MADRWSFILAVLFTLPSAWAADGVSSYGVVRLDEKIFPYSKDSPTCVLTRAGLELVREDEHVGQTQTSSVNLMAGFYETNRPECMRDFGFVQWIKGCAVNSYYWKNQNKLSQTLKWRHHLGKGVSFVHRDWVVDSVDVDPLYGSSTESQAQNPEFNRHSFHYVLEEAIGRSSDPDQILRDHNVMNQLNAGKNFIFQHLQTARARSTQWVVRDIPSMPSLMLPGVNSDLYSSTDISLEFKLCIYRTKDIPLTDMPARFDLPIEIGGPLHCFDWKINHGFDPETLSLQPLKKHPDFCQINP